MPGGMRGATVGGAFWARPAGGAAFGASPARRSVPLHRRTAVEGGAPGVAPGGVRPGSGVDRPWCSRCAGPVLGAAAGGGVGRRTACVAGLLPEGCLREACARSRSRGAVPAGGGPAGGAIVGSRRCGTRGCRRRGGGGGGGGRLGAAAGGGALAASEQLRVAAAEHAAAAAQHVGVAAAEVRPALEEAAEEALGVSRLAEERQAVREPRAAERPLAAVPSSPSRLRSAPARRPGGALLGMRRYACKLHRCESGRGKQHEAEFCHGDLDPENELWFLGLLDSRLGDPTNKR